jgi:hypothetical protein
MSTCALDREQSSVEIDAPLPASNFLPPIALVRRRPFLLSLAVIGFVGPIIFWPPIARLHHGTNQDFRGHINFALALQHEGKVLPHCLYHLLLLPTMEATKALAPELCMGETSLDLASILLNVLFECFTWALLSWLVVARLPGSWSDVRRAALGLALGLVLTTVAAVSILKWPVLGSHQMPGDTELYLGYLMPTVFHSPTFNLLRPLALAHFLATCAFLADSEVKCSRRQAFGLGVLTVLTLLAKPNYLMCLLPGLGLVGTVLFLQGSLPRWKASVAAVVVPGVAVLAVQYAVTYQSGSATTSAASSGIQFAPYAVVERWFHSYGQRPPTIGPWHSSIAFLSWLGDTAAVRLIASMLFPAVVTLTFFFEARRDRCLMLAWAAFFAAACMSFLFVETGRRVHHGNFLWCGTIAAFLLMAATTLFLLERRQELVDRCRGWSGAWRWGACGLALALHTASGAVYYTACLR